ncbi:HAD family hydrolase [Actinacidiphila acididurans]|uniref:Haloacid dehalogenase-like hydrolase n=1 Tax=Actinacidiphila acididurans TaxID=2784346 RepID=A0ABS2U6K9_9ACTN|nr:haloacid dehalogenase-like hydrolase [Actinacidiphila acididurans]MBM9509798.1 haloacid dehalogenase-like hydrolase [Actinacidiphila acididurans]
MPLDAVDASQPSTALLLWDVDHTLVSIGGGVSRTIYAKAFEHVTGQPLASLADMNGRTEQAIMVETLRLNGVEQPEALYDDFYAALAEAAHQLARRMREVGEDLPGAREAISAFAQRGVVQSAVTGNIRPIAETKLAALDLAEHLDFAVGGYGNDGSDRADLVREARARATAKYGNTFPNGHVIVIGDTPHDIRGAHDADAVAVGVATGRSSVEELANAGADVVLRSLTEYSTIERLLVHAGA